MTDNMETKPLLQVGDFARNTIHGYITFLIARFPLQFYCVIVEDGGISFSSTSHQSFTGYSRMEIPTELEKIPTSLFLINTAKEHLRRLNSKEQVDNLLYIETLYKLNEQEKELKNENKL